MYFGGEGVHEAAPAGSATAPKASVPVFGRHSTMLLPLPIRQAKKLDGQFLAAIRPQVRESVCQ